MTMASLGLAGAAGCANSGKTPKARSLARSMRLGRDDFARDVQALEEVDEAVLEVPALQSLQAPRAEVLHVEGRHDGAVEHRTLEVLDVGVRAHGGEIAHEA